MKFNSFHNTYSAKAVVINYCGVDLSEGKGEDVFLTIKHNNPRMVFTEGADGNVAPSINPIQSMRFTLTLFNTSKACQLLTNIYQALRVSDNSASPTNVALPLGITDPSGATTVLAAQCVLEEIGDNTLGMGANTRDFTFYTPHGVEIGLDSDGIKAAKDAISNTTKKVTSGLAV